MAGMRGLMADPSGRIIPMPIQSSFREGLDALEYFISIHGQRKGLADTALRTAEAGYLTRRLVDVAQDIIINNEDCGTHEGITLYANDEKAGQPLRDRIRGRVLAERVIHPETGEVIAERNEYITKEEPWTKYKDDSTKAKAVECLEFLLYIVKNLTVLSAPILVESFEKIKNIL